MDWWIDWCIVSPGWPASAGLSVSAEWYLLKQANQWLLKSKVKKTILQPMLQVYNRCIEFAFKRIDSTGNSTEKLEPG